MIYYTDGRTAPRLGREGVATMAATLAEAFMEHDNWVRVVPRPEARRRALRALFGFIGGVVDERGHVVVAVAEGRPVGYITFMENRDRAGVTLPRIVRTGGVGDVLRLLAALRPRELAGMVAFETAMARFHRDNPPDPQGLHLYSAGVLPAWKGRGLMKAAFAFAEARFREAGFASYVLETTDPGNLPVYEAFGLSRLGELAMPGSNRPAWFLERRFGPRARSD